VLTVTSSFISTLGSVSVDKTIYNNNNNNNNNRCIPSDMTFITSEILLPPCLELLASETPASATSSSTETNDQSRSNGSDITRACLVIIRAIGPFLGKQVHRVAVHLGRALDRAVSREDWVSVEKLLDPGAVQTVLTSAGPKSFEEVCLPCLLDVVELVGVPVALATRASYALADMARNEYLGPARVVRVVLPQLVRRVSWMLIHIFEGIVLFSLALPFTFNNQTDAQLLCDLLVMYLHRITRASQVFSCTEATRSIAQQSPIQWHDLSCIARHV
jgi:hypothetical protein